MDGRLRVHGCQCLQAPLWSPEQSQPWVTVGPQCVPSTICHAHTLARLKLGPHGNVSKCVCLSCTLGLLVTLHSPVPGPQEATALGSCSQVPGSQQAPLSQTGVVSSHGQWQDCRYARKRLGWLLGIAEGQQQRRRPPRKLPSAVPGSQSSLFLAMLRGPFIKERRKKKKCKNDLIWQYD